jgi:hypothetical protein
MALKDLLVYVDQTDHAAGRGPGRRRHFRHPRLWEKMLGAVIANLMGRMSLPIFMSH